MPPDHPDYRFTLANERTLLAWLRTGLGVLAPLRARAVERALDGRTGVAVPRLALAVTAVVVAVAGTALVAVLSVNAGSSRIGAPVR